MQQGKIQFLGSSKKKKITGHAKKKHRTQNKEKNQEMIQKIELVDKDTTSYYNYFITPYVQEAKD